MENYHILYGFLVTSICFSIVIAQPVTTVTTPAQEINSTKHCNVELDFSYMGLEVIKKKFISSPYVKSLTLQHNDIASFEENTFDTLSNLEHLDLSNNKLTPETLFSFGGIPSLKSLILDTNFVTRYSDSACYYRGYYRSCGTKQYCKPNFGCVSRYSNMKITYNYPNLNYLSLRNIDIDSVPSDFGPHFPKLSGLDLSENNFEDNSNSLMASIPSTVTDLILENVELTSLTDLEVQQHITLLKLNFNNFNTLSSQDCDSNTLCLKGLRNLKSLYISGCNIELIQADAFTDLTNLIYLDISDNNFGQIPDGAFDFMPNLTGLNVSRNSLSTLPKTNMLQNLSILIMDGMKNNLIFSSLEELPQLPMLEVLSLRQNQLTSISCTFLNKLPELRILDLSNNQIVSLKSWSWQSNLQKLHLNSNKILDIDDLELSEAKSLELLDLQNNMIESVKLSALKHLKDDLVLKM